jgi:hypothetical protein
MSGSLAVAGILAQNDDDEAESAPYLFIPEFQRPHGGSEKEHVLLPKKRKKSFFCLSPI